VELRLCVCEPWLTNQTLFWKVSLIDREIQAATIRAAEIRNGETASLANRSCGEEKADLDARHRS